MPLLNSASSAPSGFDTLSDIVVVTSADEAVFSFSTDVSTHAVIEYGLTSDYDHSISTEPQIIHTETIGELTSCTTYHYLVRAGDVSQEGIFETLCPVAKKVAKKATPTKKSIAPISESTSEPVEMIPTLNAAPQEQVTPEAQKQQTKKGFILSETGNDTVTPQAPALPGPIAFGDDTKVAQDTSNSTPVALILFAILSGMVVAFFAFKGKKKWYQK